MNVITVLRIIMMESEPLWFVCTLNRMSGDDSYPRNKDISFNPERLDNSSPSINSTAFPHEALSSTNQLRKSYNQLASTHSNTNSKLQQNLQNSSSTVENTHQLAPIDPSPHFHECLNAPTLPSLSIPSVDMSANTPLNDTNHRSFLPNHSSSDICMQDPFRKTSPLPDHSSAYKPILNLSPTICEYVRDPKKLTGSNINIID